MPECSICRRSYDERFQVFVPPHPEAFDRIECARRAARIWGVDSAAAVPVLLPTIAAVGRRCALRRPAAATRRCGRAAAEPWRRWPRSRSRPARPRSQQGSACSRPEAQRRSTSPLALRASREPGGGAAEHPEGRQVDMPHAARPDTSSSVASSKATAALSDAANRLPTSHSIRPRRCGRSRLQTVLSSSGTASTRSSLLAGSRVQSLAPAEPLLPDATPRARLGLDGTEAEGNERGGQKHRPAAEAGAEQDSRSRRRGRPNRRLRRRRLRRSSRRHRWPRRPLPCRAGPPSESRTTQGSNRVRQAEARRRLAPPPPASRQRLPPPRAAADHPPRRRRRPRRPPPTARAAALLGHRRRSSSTAALVDASAVVEPPPLVGHRRRSSTPTPSSTTPGRRASAAGTSPGEHPTRQRVRRTRTTSTRDHPGIGNGNGNGHHH